MFCILSFILCCALMAMGEDTTLMNLTEELEALNKSVWQELSDELNNTRKHYGFSLNSGCKSYEKVFKCMSTCKSMSFQTYQIDQRCKCSCHEMKTTTVLPFFKWRTNGTTRPVPKTRSVRLYEIVGTMSPTETEPTSPTPTNPTCPTFDFNNTDANATTPVNFENKTDDGKATTDGNGTKSNDGAKKPGDGEKKPNDAEKPKDDEKPPENDDKTPNDEIKMNDTVKLKDGENPPEDDEKRPDDDEKPPENDDKTPNDGIKMNDTVKLEDGVNPPEDDEKRPDDDEERPDDGGKKPNDGEEKPEDKKPGDDDEKPPEARPPSDGRRRHVEKDKRVDTAEKTNMLLQESQVKP